MSLLDGIDRRSSSFAGLIDGARRGERWAIDALAAECLPKLTTYADFRGAIDPGGIANTVLTELFGRLDFLSFEVPGQMWAYLFRIAQSRIIDERRASKPVELRDGHELDLLAPPDNHFDERAIDRLYIDDLLAGLTSEQQEVLRMRFLDDLSLEETATRTGRTLTAVKGLQWRAIRAISAAALVAVLVAIVGLLIAVLHDDGAVSTISEEPIGRPSMDDDDTGSGGEEGSPALGDSTEARGMPTEPVDGEPPSTTITAIELGDASKRTARFEFEATDHSRVAGYECRLDDGGWHPCSSPTTYTDLTGGSHVFQVRAIDRFGIVDPTPATRTWTVTVDPSSGTPDEIPEGAPPGQEKAPPDQAGVPPGQGGTPPGQGGTPPGQAETPPGQAETPPDQAETPPGQAETPPEQEDETPPDQAELPPGQGGTPPGHGGTPPGQAKTPPGQAKTPPGQAKTPPGQAKTPPGQAKTPPGIA